MKTLYRMLLLCVFAFGFMAADACVCRASEVMSISSNTVVRDCLENGIDENYYEYTIDTTGYITVDFLPEEPMANSGEGWDMYIYDADQNELCSYRQKKNGFSTQKFNFEPGTKLYVKVCASHVDLPPQVQFYSIRITTVAKSNWELETRKSETDEWKARIRNTSELNAEKRYGSLWTGTDSDLYKIRVPKTGNVTLEFWPNNVNGDIGWGYDIEIYKKNGEKVTEYKQIAGAVKKSFYAKKGVYYVAIKADWSKAAPPPTDDYAISATVKKSTVPSMKKKKVSYASKSSVLKWDKAKKVDGYEVRICKNRKFKKKQTTVYITTDNNYKIAKGIKRGTYYVKVCAYYETVTGGRIYGKFTKVKKITKK